MSIHKFSKHTNTLSQVGKSVDLPTSSSFFNFFVNSLLNSSFNSRYFSFYGYKKLIYFYKSFSAGCLNSLKLIKIPKSSDKKRLVYVNSLYDRLYADSLLKSLPKTHSDFVYGISDKPFYTISKKLNSFYKTKKYKFLIGDFKNFSDSIPKKKLQDLINNSDYFDISTKSHLSYFLNKSTFDGDNLLSSLDGMHTGTPITNYLLNHFLCKFDNFLVKNSTFFMRVGDDFVCVLKREDSEAVIANFIENFQKDNSLQINFAMYKEDFEFLAYRYFQNVISVRKSSVNKFLGNIASKLQVVDADLDKKIHLLKKIYYGPNGLYQVKKDFLLDYRFLNDSNQVKSISREIKRYQNRFLFGYMGFKNSNELNLILKTLKIKSFEQLFYDYKLRKIKI